MARLWHGVLAALVFFAFVGQLGLTFSADRSLLNFVSYFTIQSNLLVLVACVLLVVDPARQEPWFRVVRLAGLVGITVTGIVFATVLAGEVELTGIEWWYDKIFHYLCPVAAVLGWLLWSPRTRFRRSDLVILAWPVVWLAYTMVRAAIVAPRSLNYNGFATNYPYPFLDADREGYAAVTVNCVVVTILVTALAVAYIWASGRFERRAAPTQESRLWSP